MGTETTYFARFIIYTPLYVHEKFFKAVNFKSETKSTFTPTHYPYVDVYYYSMASLFAKCLYRYICVYSVVEQGDRGRIWKTTYDQIHSWTTNYVSGVRFAVNTNNKELKTNILFGLFSKFANIIVFNLKEHQPIKKYGLHMSQWPGDGTVLRRQNNVSFVRSATIWG